MTDTMNLDRSYIAGTYNRFPVEIVSGKGCIVKDAGGKEYIDLTSGIGVTCFGVADEIYFSHSFGSFPFFKDYNT